MALPGETLYTGALETCEDCGVQLVPKVHRSGGGFYIGTWCQCGPYSRESGYFATAEEAEAILGAHPSEYARSTDFVAESDGERTARLLEVLADALAAPGTAQLECEQEEEDDA